MKSRRRDESGVAIVLASLLFVVFFAMAALSLDLGNWYLNIDRHQRAADSAALAGAPYLPSQPDAARAAALDSLRTNGYAAASITFNGPDADRPTYMKVSVRTDVKSVFLGVLGIDQYSVGRTAYAAKANGLLMGSPVNVLGSEPGSDSWASIPGFENNFWLSQGSAGRQKSYHARWTAERCVGFEDYCDGGDNPEFDPGGFDYTIDVLNNASGQMRVQVYDPQVCTGGGCPSGDYDEGNPPRFKYTLFNPSGAELSQCGATFDPAPLTDWVTLCQLPIGNSTYPAGSYRLNVSALDSSSNGGQNSYSIRAAFMAGSKADLVASRNINVSANSRLNTAYDTNSTLHYYVAKVPSSYAGRSITIDAYDFLEDATNDIRIYWAANTSVPAEPSNCSWNRPVSGTSEQTTNGQCSFHTDPGYNAAVNTITVPIPSSYTCDMGQAESCYLKMTVNTNNGTSEGSSISLGERGSPLRLYND